MSKLFQTFKKFQFVFAANLTSTKLDFSHSIDQGTIYRNAQLRCTHIMYCTLREVCKKPSAPALILFCSSRMGLL